MFEGSQGKLRHGDMFVLIRLKLVEVLWSSRGKLNSCVLGVKPARYLRIFSHWWLIGNVGIYSLYIT